MLQYQLSGEVYKMQNGILSMKWRGKPVPKARPRAALNGHFFTPSNTARFEAAVKKALKKRMSGVAPTGASIEVYLMVDRAIPKSWSKKRIKEIVENGEHPIGPGDIDNIAKSILDAANGIVFEDDKQICKVVVSRRYATEDGFHLIIKEAPKREFPYDFMELVMSTRD